MFETVAFTTTPPVDPALFQPIADGIIAQVTAVLPIGIPILVLLAGIGITFKILRKTGVKTS